MTRHHGVTGDRGAVSVMFAVLGIGLLMATGLAVDGGRKLGALSEARDVADNAARAGAQELDETQFRLTGQPTLDPTAAQAAALQYLTTVGHTGTVTVTGDTVTVSVTIDVDTTILPLDLTASATESATAVEGI